MDLDYVFGQAGLGKQCRPGSTLFTTHPAMFWTQVHVVKRICSIFRTSTRSLGVRKAGVNTIIKFHKERENAMFLMFSIFTLKHWVNISADDILKCFTFRRKKDLTFHANCLLRRQQIVSSGDNLHGMSDPIFWENREKKHHQYVVC